MLDVLDLVGVAQLCNVTEDRVAGTGHVDVHVAERAGVAAAAAALALRVDCEEEE